VRKSVRDRTARGFNMFICVRVCVCTCVGVLVENLKGLQPTTSMENVASMCVCVNVCACL